MGDQKKFTLIAGNNHPVNWVHEKWMPRNMFMVATGDKLVVFRNGEVVVLDLAEVKGIYGAVLKYVEETA